jgi:hypothetical protein
MPNAIITLSSVGTSTPANLSWRSGKPATVYVGSSGAGSSAAFTIEVTPTDLQLIGGTSLATWFGISSNPYALGIAGATTFGASLGFVYAPLPTPVGAVRINCSSNSASVALTMFVMQGEGP